MKDIVCFIDTNELYAKKLNNYAIKKYGKDYLFLSFSSIKALIDYAEENKVKGVVLSDNFEKDIKFLNSTFYYVQTEKKDITKKDGNIRYVYKYQNVDNLLSCIDGDIKNHEQKFVKVKSKTKIVAFYSPYQSKDKQEKLIKISKYLSKNKKVLVIDLDEYSNFMGGTGFSNIIYKYKENLLNVESIKKEIVDKNGMQYIEGVSYPEDYAVINNADLSNIITEFREIDYDYIFVDCDESFIRNQYLFIDSDNILLFGGGKVDTNKIDIFMKYVEQQNMIDTKKIYRFSKDSIEKKSIQNIVQEIFNNQ